MTLCIDPELVTRGSVDVDGHIDQHGIRYIGTATKMPDGTWRCFADVFGRLCLVEVKLRYDPEAEL